MKRLSALLGLSVAVSFVCSAQNNTDPQFVSDFEFRASDGSILIEDGDSFWMGNHRVRLYGVDTVETSQICTNENQSVNCHKMTLDYVNPLFNDPDLVCKPLISKHEKPWVQDNRYVSICFIGDIEVNRKIVSDGWAVSYRRIGGDPYEGLETEAKRLRRGLHAYDFERPYEARQTPESCPAPARTDQSTTE